MASGKPVIATDGGGVRDIIKNGISGLLIHSSDIVENLTHMVENRELRERISMGGLAEVKRYDWKCVASEITELYENILYGN